MKPGEISLAELKPGMVGINFKSNPFDVMGSVTRVLEGGSKACHTWIMLPNGKIGTTGAVMGILYGEVDPLVYLKEKSYVLIQTVDPLPKDKLDAIQAAHERLMGSGIKRLYGAWKYAWLWAIAVKDGLVTKTGIKPADPNHVPEFPVCSQCVGYELACAGIFVGKGLGLQDWSAVLPSTLLEEATRTSEYIDSGVSLGMPCYRLRLLSDKTFHGLVAS